MKLQLKYITCIAVTNSGKPKNPCRLTSARAQSCLSCERDKLERAKNLVASFPDILPSPSATYQCRKPNQSKWIVSIWNCGVRKSVELTWISQMEPFLILFGTRPGLHLWKSMDKILSIQFSLGIQKPERALISFKYPLGSLILNLSWILMPVITFGVI